MTEKITPVEIKKLMIENSISFQELKSTYIGDNAQNIADFLFQEYNITITEQQISAIRSKCSNGKIAFPVVVNATAVYKRITYKIGSGYNHPADCKVSIANALGFDRRSSGIYILFVNDSNEPDTDMRISWDKKQEKLMNTDVLRMTEYMALYDYLLTTANRKIDSGGTWTRTESTYSCSDYVAKGDTPNGEFRLDGNVRDDDRSGGGYRAVSDIIMI